MDLHGSIAQNLQLAVDSSRRLRGHPIHKDTLVFWTDLIKEARARRAAGDDAGDPSIEASIAELEVVISQSGAASSATDHA